jgi:hypothetical protein
MGVSGQHHAPAAEAVGTYEMSVSFYQTTRRKMQQGSHRRDLLVTLFEVIVTNEATA